MVFSEAFALFQSFIIYDQVNPLLKVTNLTVSRQIHKGERSIIRDVSFTLGSKSILALVGESGSGKTSLCRALTRLLPAQMRTHGSVLWRSTDLLNCSEVTLREIRKTKIRYVFQEPFLALNPLLKIGSQLRHASPDSKPSRAQMNDTLQRVGLAADVLTRYPHQLSIGMQQRVMIAMATMAKPALLIADEPTSALDESLRTEMLDLLKSFQALWDMSVLLVTHDLSFARKFADFVGVLYQGNLVEMATVDKFFQQPQHSYSKLLVESLTRSCNLALEE